LVARKNQRRSEELTQRGINDDNKGDATGFGGTAINVLVASGFSIVGIIRPEYLLPAGSAPTQASLILALYAAARTIPLACLH
jgi:hypothetical protein